VLWTYTRWKLTSSREIQIPLHGNNVCSGIPNPVSYSPGGCQAERWQRLQTTRVTLAFGKHKTSSILQLRKCLVQLLTKSLRRYIYIRYYDLFLPKPCLQETVFLSISGWDCSLVALAQTDKLMGPTGNPGMLLGLCYRQCTSLSSLEGPTKFSTNFLPCLLNSFFCCQTCPDSTESV